jgi:BNR repeat protein
MRRLAVILLIPVVFGCLSREPAVRFAAADTVSRVTDVGTAPMFAVSPAGNEAVAWVSAPGGGTDGRLYVSVAGGAPIELRDPLGPIEAHGESPPKLVYAPDGALAALYVVARVAPGKRFPIAALRFTRSSDGGRTWSEPATVTDDRTFGEHNFHALHAARDGALYVAWLDGREGKSAAYLTRSTDGGRTWETNRRVATGDACPCCRAAVATASDGTVYVAWRQVLAGNIRDVVVAKSADHGRTWTAPVRVHADDWVFAGCPHAGPALQVDTHDRLHVVWWTGKAKAAGVYYARSDDGAKTFTSAVPLGTAEFSQPAHVQLALGPAGEVAAAWDDGTKQVPQIVVRVSLNSGRSFGPRVPVSAAGRWAGFPVLVLRTGAISVAWSEESVEAAVRAAQAMPDMKNPKAMMGLKAVGTAQVLVRRGTIL